MKGYIINPDKEYTQKIIEGIYKKDGHCPCRVYADETTLCPCDQFISEGICKCNLYVKIQ
jgi:ferredoxin-thioredoxin reductase catalytic subunit